MSESIWHVLTVVLLVGFVLLGVGLVAVMRQVGGLLILVQPNAPKEIGGGPEIGERIEGFNARPALVVFVAPDCQPCTELTPSFVAFRRAWPDVELVAAVARGTDAERQAYAQTLGDYARPDMQELYERWEVRGTPYGVALDSGGRVRAKGVVNTLDQLEELAHVATIRLDDLVDSEPVPVGMEEHSRR